MSKILITGAGGFVGCHIVSALAAQGHSIRAVTRGRRPDGWPDQIEHVCVPDLCDESAYPELLDGCSHVLHLAARAHILSEDQVDPITAFRNTNVDLTDKLAKAAAKAGVQRFVFASSIGVHLVSAQTLDQDWQRRPYQASKFVAEEKLQDIAHHNGGAKMQMVILRAPSVYGADAPGTFGLLLKAINKSWPLPFGSLKNRRSFIYIDNLVSALDACLFHESAAGGVFEVADPEAPTMPELIDKLSKAMGRKKPILLPFPTPVLRLLFRFAGMRQQGENITSTLVVDDQNIRQRLGWKPPYELDQGLARLAGGKDPSSAS